MGLLDSLASSLLDTDGDEKKGPKLSAAEVTAFIQAAVGIIAKMGLPKLIEAFSKAGLKDEVMSWIGKGVNKAVSGDQVQKALGPKLIGELAKKSGIELPEAAGALARYLPKVVDALTPDGDADEGKVQSAIAGFDLGDAGKLLGSFFSK